MPKLDNITKSVHSLRHVNRRAPFRAAVDNSLRRIQGADRRYVQVNERLVKHLLDCYCRDKCIYATGICCRSVVIGTNGNHYRC